MHLDLASYKEGCLLEVWVRAIKGGTNSLNRLNVRQNRLFFYVSSFTDKKQRIFRRELSIGLLVII